jgi:FkbM family methyltransferase
MQAALAYFLKYLEQSGELPLAKKALLVLKVIEFAVRRTFATHFTMTDIWGIKHRYSPKDIMGFKTAIGVYELEEQLFFYRVLRLASTSTVIDVGSAVGTFTSLFAKYAGKQAKIFSFEPSPFSCRYQEEQLRLNGLQDKVQVFQMGLGDENSVSIFSFVEGIEGSLWGRFDGAAPGVQFVNAEVQIARLDSIPEIQALDQLDFVKIDIEGFEYPALCGMEETLTKFKPVILCEMALSFLIEYDGNRYKDMLDLFRRLEYEPYLLKNGKLKPYTWPEARVMNLILLPRLGGPKSVSQVRNLFGL